MLLTVLVNPIIAGGSEEKGKRIEKEFYGNGRIHFENVFRDGLLIRRRAFYESGRLLLDYRYKEGAPVVLRNYYGNGKLKSIWTAKTKEFRFYTNTGKLKATIKTGKEDMKEKYNPSYIFSAP